MSYHTRSLTSSSSTLIVSPFPLDHHLNGIPTGGPVLKLVTALYSGWSFPELEVGKRMGGKGFIEPHRNNLPRRKRRVVTTPEDIAPEMDKTSSQNLLPMSEAGPRSLIEESTRLRDGASIHDGSTTTPPPAIQTQTYASSLVETNITEPPASRHASPTPSAPLHKSPAPFNSPTSYPTFQTPKPAPFHDHHFDDASPQSPPITPSKGHLQPTSATLPRRRRSVAQEQERRRRIAGQQTSVAVKDVSGLKSSQTRADADPDLVANSESQSMRRRQSICAQELSKGITLGFLAEGHEHDGNIVRIQVYDDATTSFSSFPPSSSPSSAHLQLSLPTDPLSYTDGTTSLTDSQIQQACTFIDEHISIPLADSSSTTNTLVRPGRVSVLIVAPRTRPEEAMSIGVSYLAGIEGFDKGVEGDETSDDHDDFDDYTYSTVHRLLMAFHDSDPGSPILEAKVDRIDMGGSGGLRPEWRGVLSFDGMERLDEVWTRRRS